MTKPINNPLRARGLTLIEVLVTLAILAVPLLGMASMQLTGIRSSNASGFRTQANIYINDMVEQLRANREAVQNGNFVSYVSGVNINCAAPPVPYCSEFYDGTDIVDSDSCSPAEMAVHDVNVWFCGELNNGARAGGIAANLPQASASVVCNDSDGSDAEPCTLGSTHTVSVSWVEPNPQSDGPSTIAQNVSITLQP